MTIDGTNASVTEGKTLAINTTVNNTGSADGTQDIVLKINGTKVKTNSSVNIASGSSKPVNFTYTTQSGDAPAVEVNVSSDDDYDTTTADILKLAFINGTVRDTDGISLSGVTVVVLDTKNGRATGPVGPPTTTDANGNYSVSVSAGTYWVIADNHPSHRFTIKRGQSIASGNTTTVDIQLKAFPEKGWINGTYLDTNGNPVTNATVTARDLGYQLSGQSGTNDAGQFNISVPAANYALSASPNATDPNISEQTRSNVTVRAGETTTVTLQSPASGFINGTVTDPTGAAQSQNTRVIATGGGHTFFSQTDESGAYNITAPAGDYTVSVFSEGGTASAKRVTVPEDAKTTADFTLKNVSVVHSSVEVINGSSSVDTEDVDVRAAIDKEGLLRATVVNDSTYGSNKLAGPGNLNTLGATNSTEFRINLTVTNYSANALLWGIGDAKWSTSANASVTNGTDITISGTPVNLQATFAAAAGGQQDAYGAVFSSNPQWASGREDRADDARNRTIFLSVSDLSNLPEANQQRLVGTSVTTNAQKFTLPQVINQSLEVWVAGPSTTVEGESHDGFYRAFIPEAQLDEWSVDDPTQELNTLYKGGSANFTVDETDDGPNGRAGAWIKLRNISYSAGEVNVTANPQTDTTDDNDSSGNDGGGTNARRSSSAAGPEVIEEPEAIEEVIENPPADIQPQRAEQAPITVDEATGKARVTFTEESTTESITFRDADVDGEVTVAEYDSEPEKTGGSPGRSVAVTQITVPDPNRSATIRKRVSTERLEEIDTDAEDLHISRFDDEAGEWQALETEAVERTAERVVLEAVTPGFSFFAVSAVSEPDAVITAPSEVVVDEAFTLDGSGSSDEYGEIVSYEWVVAGESLTGETVTTTINTAGEITIELTVENDAGETTTETITVVVGDDDDPDEGTGSDSGDEETEPAGETNETDVEAEADGDAETEDLDGFGVVVALIALLAAALVARRRT